MAPNQDQIPAPHRGRLVSACTHMSALTCDDTARVPMCQSQMIFMERVHMIVMDYIKEICPNLALDVTVQCPPSA